MAQGEDRISARRQLLESRLENYRKSRDGVHPSQRIFFDLAIEEIERELGIDGAIKPRQAKAPLAAKRPPTHPPRTEP